MKLYSAGPHASRYSEFEWHPWFAWKPVETIKWEVVWLESIYRRRVNPKIPHVDDFWEYMRHTDKVKVRRENQ